MELKLIIIRWIPVERRQKNLGECEEGFSHGWGRVDLRSNTALSQLGHGKSEVQGVLTLEGRMHEAL